MHDTEIIDLDQELYKLTRSQAVEILEAFLNLESQAFENVTIGAIALDYTQASVIEALRQVATEFKAGLPPESDRNLWYVRLGYYFGESLRRAAGHLHWSVGEADTAFQNHPVITGFNNGVEAATITISRNLLLAVAIDDNPFERIDRAVNLWFDQARE